LVNDIKFRVPGFGFMVLGVGLVLLEPSPYLFEQIRIAASARGGLELLKKSKVNRKGSENFRWKP